VRSSRARRRSFGSQSALGRGPSTPEAHDAVLVALVDRVTRRMRAKGRAGRTVILRLRFGDFTRATRSQTLPRPTAATRIVLAAGRALLRAARPTIDRRGLTLLGITVAGLDGDAAQLALPLDGARDGALDAVVDDVRDRFGPGALTRAVHVRRAPSLATWLFPDEGAEGEG